MTFRPLSPDAQREHERYQTDLRYFCKRALRIKLKEGGDAPFVWNRAQEYLHARIESQLARTGKVRMYIIKGRQQGISTYIEARLYHKVTRQRGKKAFILSHHSETTETLFNMVDRFHLSCPVELTLNRITNNNKRMLFENGSQYTVGTAGGGTIGRGDTNQFFHGSEVAFYENIDDISTGVMQTVADIPNTEKYNESTANGIGNYFHRGCMDALAGDSEYELVFIPWYWQDEYRASVKPNTVWTSEEYDLKQMYELDDQQLQWRRNKISEFKAAGNSERKFKQEYPFTVKEAFQASGNALIDAEKVAKARKATFTDRGAPIVLGVDPGPIHDRTAIAWRQGRHVIKIEKFIGLSQMGLVGKLATRIDRHPEIAKVFIDVAEGRGAVDRLHELNYGDIVTGISFAMQPTDDLRYANKRAEMAGDFKEWLEDDLGVRLPDNEGSENVASGDEIEIEIGVIPEWKDHSGGRLILAPKKDIIKIYGKSPDLFDSLMLTFAQPVRNGYTQNNRIRKTNITRKSELSAVNRRQRARKQDDNWTDSPDDGFKRLDKPFRRQR